MLQKFARFFAEYFVFVVGSLFIFIIGFLYAYIKPEGVVFNLVFLAIAVGWIIYMVKYFWELMEKHNSSNGDSKTQDLV